MKKALQILIVVLAFLFSCQGKTPQKEKEASENKVGFTDSIDQAIFNSFKEIAYAHALDSMAVENRVIEVAKMFLQTPYAGGTLENENGEKLVVNFRELDCTTYLENVLALSRVFGKRDVSEADFLK